MGIGTNSLPQLVMFSIERLLERALVLVQLKMELLEALLAAKVCYDQGDAEQRESQENAHSNSPSRPSEDRNFVEAGEMEAQS